ncbi:hypothetical protein DdX_21786 [Ditylenchus destructor]|uniref:Uncharacterized protein n=1 Tax=Ditylenchus destructor TaxID=166010 RepID=A0AAD4QR77_9BILA|nr:hypothetical protein DdX_21786 [Ditylenchus destructor]
MRKSRWNHIAWSRLAGAHLPAHEAQGVRQHRGAQQTVVGGVGQQRAVHHRVVGQRRDGAHPDRALRRGRAHLRRDQVLGVDAAVLDAVRLDRLGAPWLGQAVAERDALVQLADEPVGAFHLGHVELVLDAFVHGLERGGHFKNDALLLARHHVAGGEAAAVAHAVDAVLDGRMLARQQEIGVHGMHRPLGAHGEARGHQRLPSTWPPNTAGVRCLRSGPGSGRRPAARVA